MYVLKNNLYREISKFSKVFIYGAGNYANKVYALLKNGALEERICSFVVTDLKEHGDIDGIPIRCVDDLASFFEEDCVVLIAVSKEHEDEVAQLLRSKRHVHTIKITEYMVHDNDFYEMLKEQSDKEFIESVISGCSWESIGSTDEFVIDSCIVQRNRENIDKNTIVYISGYLNPRSEKIISALVKKKYHVIVLEYACINELVRAEIMSYNIDFFHCRDVNEVFYRALHYRPLVYYFEPEWGCLIGPEIMIRHKNLFGKIVFAPYDLMNDGYVGVLEKDSLSERYCLEKADGIVWRGFSKEFLEEKKGFTYIGKSIQLADYCKGFAVGKNNKSDNRLKLCFVQGGIYELLNETVDANYNTYTEPAKISTILSRIGNINDCIFHFFVGRCNDGDRKKLEELEKKYAGFKVFYGIKYNELIIRLSEYDYGCFFMTGGKNIPEEMSIDNLYYGSLYDNSIANRYFDYLDANIPVIGTLPRKQCECLEQYGVIVKMDLSNLDIDFLKKNKKRYKSNVENVKPKLLMDNHIQRLIDWFNAL